MTNKIPHLIHQTWKTGKIPDSLVDYQETWKKYHPEWDFYLWTDFDNLEFIRKYYSWFLPIYESYPETIMRVDAIRYFILDHFGGLYVDLDYECLRPAEPLLADHSLILGFEPQVHLQRLLQKPNLSHIIGNAWMASIPHHPFWEHLIKKLVKYHEQPGVLDATGPFLLTRAYDSYSGNGDIQIEPARLLYPITNTKTWDELEETEKISVRENAYGIHHWYGGWIRPNQTTKQGLCQAVITDHKHEINQFWLNIEKYLSIQNVVNPQPIVSCMMVTRDRPVLGGRAVDCFRRQTYQAKELVILDDGSDPSLEEYVNSLNDPSIRYHRLPAEGKTLGELRNLAVQLSSGEFIAQWDDDDLSDPSRLEVQMAAMTLNQCDVSILSREMIWFPDEQKLAESNDRPWENSFICKKSVIPAYPRLRKGEDTDVIDKLLASQRVIFLLYPKLYLYTFHGLNTFDKDHWDKYWLAANRTYEGEAYHLALDELSRLFEIDLSQKYKEAKPPSPIMVVDETIADRSITGQSNSVPTQPMQTDTPTVLILVPVKNSEKYIDRFLSNLNSLSYPHHLISIGFLESDSTDHTYAMIAEEIQKLEKDFARVELFKKDYSYQLQGPRWEAAAQYQRRSVLARSRNYLLSKALQNEDWVLWLDVDVARYPQNILEQMLLVKKEIIVPNCQVLGTGQQFDLNSYKYQPSAKDIDWRQYIVDGLLQPPAHMGRWYLNELQLFDIVELDGVGSAMLLVKADLHREGLIFPTFSYQYTIESEGLAVMARDMGYSSYGLPNLCIQHPGY